MAKSSKTHKVTRLTRTVRGIVFWPKKLPHPFYPSVHAWAEAGYPDDVWVYDSVDTLRAYNIKILDAHSVFGVWARLPRLLKEEEREITVVSSLSVEVTPARPKKKLKGIVAADTKSHNKLVY